MAEATIDTFELGGRTFRAEGFTFDQLKILLPNFAQIGNPWDAAGIDAQREVIRAALTLTNQISAEELDELKVRLDQIDTAVAVIAKVSGLAEMGERIARANQTQSKAGTTSTP